MTNRQSSLLSLLVVGASFSYMGGSVEHDGPGNLRTMSLGGQRFGITTEIQMPSRGWIDVANTRSFWRISSVDYSEENGKQIWSGRAAADNGIGFTYTQAFREDQEGTHLSARVTSETSQPLEGVFFMIRLPVHDFGGGACSLSTSSGATASIELPKLYPGAPHLLFSTASRLRVADSEGNIVLSVDVPAALSVTVQDNREWGDPAFGLLFRFHTGSLAPGSEASVQVSLALSGVPDSDRVHLTVDPRGTGQYLEGWGGNYVFCTEGPQVDFTLSNLRVAWARTQMSLRDWEPSNDNSSPEDINWDYFDKRDQTGSDLRREFQLKQKIAAQGIPQIVSIWYLPKWLQETDGTSVPRSRWNELFESVTSYLLYLKREYAVEPQLFSFNEPELGIHVLFSPQEHRDAIRELGSRFESLGLSTKLLLGDTASARGTVQFLQPVVEDPEALRHVSAVAFHSWHGASAAEYEEWRSAADQLDLALLVTEAGSDASAYYFPFLFSTFGYALDDLQNYMGFLQSARPQAVMIWEYTCDYPLLVSDNGSLQPTPRYWFVKHLSDLTPTISEHLLVESDQDSVLAVGYRDTSSRPHHYVLHIANFGPSRPVVISGIPPGINLFRQVRSSEQTQYEESFPVRVADGHFHLDLVSQSLTTLSGAVEGQWRWRRRLPRPGTDFERITHRNRGQSPVQ